MFLFKKFLTPLFYSLSLTVMLLVIGVMLLWFTRRQKTGKIVTAVAVCLTLILTLSPLPDLMLKHLEDRYPPLLLDTSGKSPAPPGKWVVVLGGGVKTDTRLPLVDQMAPNALVRLVEGIRIHHKMPGSKLILSGGAIYTNAPEALLQEKIALDINVRPENIILESKSRDTEEQARAIVAIVGKDRFILVTSAFHMPRAMALFQKYGARPVAAPVNRLSSASDVFHFSMLYPSASGFYKADIVIHEYLGISWIWLKNLLS